MRRAVLSLLAFVSASLFLLPTLVLAFDTVLTFDFDASDLVLEKVDGYDRVKMADARFPAEPGTPSLPVRFVQMAIPADLELEKVEVVLSERQELPGTYRLYPAQRFYPVSSLPTKGEKVEFVEPDPAVYALNTEYPGKLAEVTNNGFLGGQHIAGVALYPLQYVPAEGRLILYTRIEFRLVFRSASHSPAPVNRRSAKTVRFYSDLAKSMVINPEDVQLDTKGFLPQDEEIDYLIITDASFVPTFQELADWKILKAISTDIKDVSWVLSNYPGSDDQERIRNCIRDYYANYGTKWVLLGGDTDIIPHRSAQISSIGELIPCDQYFSDLDSNWDANGNHIYGEWADSVDMYPDVFVGRAPSNDVSQAQTFVNKCLVYETNPPIDYQTKTLYAAEELWPGTDAAVLKNYIDSSFVPDYFQATKLYETSGNLNRATFGAALNEGQNIVNHNGHGNFDVISIGPEAWFSSDMDGLVNTPRYSLFYTIGCITAAIDVDCIGEHFVNNPDGGGFAYCGNSRFGWGLPGYPLEGPGAEFDIEFFRVLFHSGDYQVGKTLGNSKLPFIPIAQQHSGLGVYYRWTVYTLLLLGDPTLELWTDIPAELSVSHASVFFAGMSYFEVNVAQDSALVSCVKDGEILGTAYSTGGSATVHFDHPVAALGTMWVTVTKRGYIPCRDTVVVVPPEGPYVIYHSHEMDDYGGNGNGAVNPGEIIHTSITVKNIGIETANGVSATLREDDDYVVVTDSVKSFGDIGPEMTAQSIGDYVFQVDASCPDSHLVKFTLKTTDGENSWLTHFYQMVAENRFVIAAVPDTVIVEKGDSASIKLILISLGGFNSQVDLSHSALPPEVSGFLDPDYLVPTDSLSFKLYTSPDVYPGIYAITVTADGQEITQDKEVVLGVMAPSYGGPVWHVSTGGHDFVGNGSEEFPFGSIQKGINSATGGDTVLVDIGRYKERINFLGKPILVASHFIFDGLESTIESTVIDADYTGPVVSFQSGEDSNSVIRGFTLTRGLALSGAGVSCYVSSPTIAENFLVENKAVGTNAGCIAGEFARPRIFRNLIHHNSCKIGIYLELLATAQVINNTVCDNSYCGILIRNGCYALVKNNIICNNGAYGMGKSESSYDILYNDVYGHEQNYSDNVGDQTGINGNISADPVFADTAAGDYHLTPGSPCIDAGDPTDWIPAGGGAGIDMGAFEYQVNGPWVVYISHVIDDYAGNDNGALNPGDVVDMPITVRNTGTQTAYGVSGILSEEDDYVVVTGNTQYFGDIEPEMMPVSSGAYSFVVDPFCPDSHEVTFELELTDGSSVWIDDFVEIVADTDFALTATEDTVRVFPGSSARLEVILTSLGGFASQVELTHSELPPAASGVFDPNSLVPPGTSIFTINTIPDVPCGIYPVTISAAGGGISHVTQFECWIFRNGDANGDGGVDVGDIVYLISYLYRGGLPPDPPEAGDANWDGQVTVEDLVYLINYLFRDGPHPAGESTRLQVRSQKRTQGQAPAAWLWVSRGAVADAKGSVQTLIQGTFAVDLGGVQLTIEYDSQESVLTPLLPSHLQDLQIFSAQKDGLVKVGILDMKGNSYIPAGSRLDLLILESKSVKSTNLKIKEAILADRKGSVIPVKILTDGEKEELRPKSFTLFQNYPNPFNPQTQIRYAIPKDCDVKVTIYNLLGQRVRILVDERQRAGSKTVHWDGKDEQGVEVASGIYFYKIQAEEFVQTKKMLLLK